MSCDAAPVFLSGALRAAIRLLDPELIIGIGAWATKRARAALGEDGAPIGTVLHPSPASPKANRGWAPQAEAVELDV